MLLLLNVEIFCCFFWMRKVFAHTFGCWRFLLLLFYVKGYCFYSLMFKVFTFGFKCWKFLLLLSDIEGFYFCSWMLKVLALTIRCWRFLLLNVIGSYFYSWMLKVCDFWSFVYLHILKKNDVEIYSILFRSWLYKFSLTYNDEIFLKGDLMIIILHMSFFCLNICDDFYCFYVIGPNFHYVSIHQHQNYVYKVKFFQKYLKL